MSETSIMNKTIKELNELKLVGFRVLCSGDEYILEIPKAASHLSERISEIKQVVNPLQWYGVFVVENETIDTDGYWVCVEVKEYKDFPSDMVTLTVPSQMYAVIRHKGDNKKIMNSYDELHKWIDENNYTRLKDKWHIEKYNGWTDIDNVDVELCDTILK
mgnify:FL=1